MIDLDIRVQIHGLYLAKLQREDCASVKGQSTRVFNFTRLMRGKALSYQVIAVPGHRGAAANTVIATVQSQILLRERSLHLPWILRNQCQPESGVACEPDAHPS